MSSDEYVRHLVLRACAQLAQDCGWETVQGEALECLTDVALRYLEEVGAQAKDIASSAGPPPPSPRRPSPPVRNRKGTCS